MLNRLPPYSQKNVNDFKVRISNLPAKTTSQQIVSLLHTICSLSHFDQIYYKESCSVIVHYSNPAEALCCERELKGRRFNGRELMTELIMEGYNGVRNDGHDLEDEISRLGDVDRTILYGLLNNLAKNDQTLFEEFILSRKNLLNALLGKDTE